MWDLFIYNILFILFCSPYTPLIKNYNIIIGFNCNNSNLHV